MIQAEDRTEITTTPDQQESGCATQGSGRATKEFLRVPVKVSLSVNT